MLSVCVCVCVCVIDEDTIAPDVFRFYVILYNPHLSKFILHTVAWTSCSHLCISEHINWSLFFVVGVFTYYCVSSTMLMTYFIIFLLFMSCIVHPLVVLSMISTRMTLRKVHVMPELTEPCFFPMIFIIIQFFVIFFDGPAIVLIWYCIVFLVSFTIVVIYYYCDFVGLSEKTHFEQFSWIIELDLFVWLLIVCSLLYAIQLWCRS